jgi:uncharacterized membrane protein YvbJ
MRYCTQCGAQVADDAKFCPECGASLTEAAGNGKGSSNAGKFGDILLGMAAGYGARHMVKNLILIGIMVFMLLVCLVIALIVNATGGDGGATADAAASVMRLL